MTLSGIFHMGFLSQTFTIQRTAGEGGAISLTPLYRFHPLHRHLDISRAIAVESSPLHIARGQNQTEGLWFPGTSCYPLSYEPFFECA